MNQIESHQMQSDRLCDYQDITSKLNEGFPKKFKGFNSSPFKLVQVYKCDSISGNILFEIRSELSIIYVISLLVSKMYQTLIKTVCHNHISKH